MDRCRLREEAPAASRTMPMVVGWREATSQLQRRLTQRIDSIRALSHSPMAQMVEEQGCADFSAAESFLEVAVLCLVLRFARRLPFYATSVPHTVIFPERPSTLLDWAHVHI